MNVQSFVDNVPHILSSHGGIERIRDIVLSLAFGGAFATHSSAGIDDLLASFDISKKTSRRRRSDSIRALPGYHLIPSHWQWVTLDRIGHDWGQTKPASNFTYIDVSSIDNKRGTISESPKLLNAATAPSRARKIVKKGTVIYSTVRPYLRNIAIVDKDLEPNPIASTAFSILHPYEGVDAKYIYYYLRSPAFVSYVESVQSGIAYPAISDKKFFSGVIPLCSPDEQKRIVAKVDELMGLCDKLEGQQQERERRFPVLSRSCHARFVEAPTPDNLKAIFGETGAVSCDDLRSTILDLAFKGFLVAQDPEDEPASILIERARATKSHLIETGIIKKEPWANKLADASQIYSLPRGWAWTRVTDVVEKVTVGFVGSMKKHYRDQGIPFLRSQNVRENRYETAGLVYISEEFHQSISKSALKPSDVVVTRSGNVGVTCVIPKNMQEANCSDLVIIKQPIAILPSYLCYFINSVASHQIAANTVGIALTHYNTKSVAQMTVPLPPLAEQHRIVAKVDQLMALVDQLVEQQRQKEKVAEAFAKAAVSAITGTEIKEPEKMKAPKTELVSRLQIKSKPKATDQAPLADLLWKHQSELTAKTLWQQSGLEIDAFYQQLKTEMANGWIVEPEKAVMKEAEAN